MYQEFFSILILLLILVDPFGNIPFFMSVLKKLPERQQRIIIIRENIIACIALIVFVFTGDWLLSALNLSPQALTISGGIILFLIATSMVFPNTQAVKEEFSTPPFIVPLAIPMIAGPASLTTALLVSKQSSQLILILAIVSAITINVISLSFGPTISKLFGKTGMQAMEKLIGLVLITIAVQMIINGLKVAFEL